MKVITICDDVTEEKIYTPKARRINQPKNKLKRHDSSDLTNDLKHMSLKNSTNSFSSSITDTSILAFSLKSSTNTGTDDLVQAMTALSINFSLKKDLRANIAHIVFPLPTLIQKRHLLTLFAKFTASC